MASRRQWLELGLDALPAGRADRVRLFRLAVGIAAAMRARLDRELAPAGITSQQAALLQLVEAHPEPPTVSQVAAVMGVSHQNVKQVAAALARKGFLTIEVDPDDRRARRLAVTPHHRRFWRRRNPGDFDRVEAWTAALDDAEVATAVRLLGRLAAHLADV